MALKSGEITELLSKCPPGDPEVQQAIFALIYKDLRRRAKQYLRSERRNHTIQATALVHEAYLRFSQHPPLKLQNRSHLFAVLSRAMRQVLVDHARGFNAVKRSGVKISLQSALVYTVEQSRELVDLDQALQIMAKRDPRLAQVVEMRFFGGFSTKEIAAALNISERTVKRDWDFARAWLYGELTKA